MRISARRAAESLAACLAAGGLFAMTVSVGGAAAPVTGRSEAEPASVSARSVEAGTSAASAASADATSRVAVVDAPPAGGGPELPAERYAYREDDSVPTGLAALLDGFDPRVHTLEGETLVSPLDGGSKAVLTLHPGLQAHVASRFAAHEVPYGALVAIEPSTGRVLAYVSHSSANPRAGDLVLDPTPPTASVFKIITGAALLDAGVGEDTRVCYHGGANRLEITDLRDDVARDRWCATLTEAMGGSINSVFAKLADRHLNPPAISRYASAFGWGQRVPFDIAVRPSPAEVPDERLEFARTAAGFWHTHISPLHAGLLAATVANDGQMPRAAIVHEVLSADGERVYQHEPSIYRSVLTRRTARRTGDMMRRTVTHGTARSAFYDRQGNPFLPGIAIAGKTGTLTGSDPYRGYTWWVGFAPADAPTIAVAALVVNDPEWRVKASYIAREALRYYLIEASQRTRTAGGER